MATIQEIDYRQDADEWSGLGMDDPDSMGHLVRSRTVLPRHDFMEGDFSELCWR